jgi:3-oxoacyl-[acyl-carrier-protein] synthase-3
MTVRAAVQRIVSYLPSCELTNDDLARELGDWDAAKIYEKTGIASRRIAAAEECSSDLAVAAGKALFASGACEPGEIDYLLLCTQSPDYFLPATACLVQDRLGLPTSCGAIDFNQGCSGFVYGLSLAKGLIESGVARNVLLITAETYSKFTNRRDRSVRTLFGDAAAATLVRAAEDGAQSIGPFVFGTDGRGAENLIVRAGGMRQPLSEAALLEREDKGGNWRAEANLFMNGPEIFNFTLSAVPKAVNELLRRAGKTAADVDYFVFHQANRFMLDKLRAKMNIPPEKFCLEMESCGNTVSSTIPIALERARNDGRIAAGANVMVVGFGVGYSWGAAMMRVA